jgi:hypothetical protein
MRKLAAGLLVALFTIVLATPVFAKTETVTGRFVDLACYMKDHANVANAHKGTSETWAQDCAERGCRPRW